jgi:lipoprotein-anchoring transpeptidase ErfK/SrfK
MIKIPIRTILTCAATAATIAVLAPVTASAQPFAYAAPRYSNYYSNYMFDEVTRDRGNYATRQNPGELPAHLRRQVVSYATTEPPGTIVVDTPNTYLYFVLGGGKAVRYGIGVGREGFTWSGVKTIERKAEWPDWVPPPEMIRRQPYLPRWVAGGSQNPLGARAMYIGGTIYRIHGTNQPDTIGHRVSSGCIRMVNEDVIDLYGRVHVGSKVVVLNSPRRSPAMAASAQGPAYAYAPAAPSAAQMRTRPSGLY